MIHMRETAVSGLRMAAAVAVAGLLGASGLSAQDDGQIGPTAGSVSFDASGGVGLAAGEFEELVDPGGSAGGGITYHVTRVFGIRAGADVQFFEKGTDDALVTFSDMRVVHFGGGIEVNFLPNADATIRGNRWTGSLSVGAGASNLDADPVTAGSVTLNFDQTYFSAHGLAKLGFQATEAINVFLSPKVYLVAADEQDTRVFSEFSRALARSDLVGKAVEPFDTAWIFPLHLGARITLR